MNTKMKKGLFDDKMGLYYSMANAGDISTIERIEVKDIWFDSFVYVCSYIISYLLNPSAQAG